MIVEGLVLLLATQCISAFTLDPSRMREKDVTLQYEAKSSRVLGGVPIVDPPKRTAGYFKLDKASKEAEMFFFHFQARQNPTQAPVVLWMTGGPGCSSELAIFYENGPYSINANMSLTETQYGWDVNHNMLFIDQPINTGFSYSYDDRDRVYDETLVAEDMLDFLQEFFAVHPEVADNELYITGESYAGHYVPAVSHRIWLSNKNQEGAPINLKGLAIGNGLTNPAIQFKAYAPFALQNNIITKELHDSIQWFYPICNFGINACNNYDFRFICMLALNWCQASVFGRIMGANPNMNVYDITKTCDGPLCYDFSRADTYLNNAAIKAQLGVGDIEWEGCNMAVNFDMQGDWLKSYDQLLPEMLADGVRIMIYAGELDLICNWLGNARWVDALPWSQQAEWAQAQTQPWNVGYEVAGSVKQAGPLSFVKVAQAGHMVPMDQPKHALDMITKFTRGESLAVIVPSELKPAQRSQAAPEMGPKMMKLSRARKTAAGY